MAQKLRSAKQIPEEEFRSLAEGVLKKNRTLLEMLAKV
jgi:hypothetical protein